MAGPPGGVGQDESGGGLGGVGEQFGQDAGVGVGCDAKSHVVSELVEEVRRMPGT
jgi:hypothetical protein